MSDIFVRSQIVTQTWAGLLNENTETQTQGHMWRWRLGLDLCCYKTNVWGYWILRKAMEVIFRDSVGRMCWWYNGDFSHLPRVHAEEIPVRTSNLDFKSPQFKETTFLLLSNLVCGSLFQLSQILTLTIKCMVPWNSPKPLPSELEPSRCRSKSLILGYLSCGNAEHNMGEFEKLWEGGVWDDTDEH
jgi:hypothetical protein